MSKKTRVFIKRGRKLKDYNVRYPWNEWFKIADGKPKRIKLEKDIDFTCSVDSFHQQIKNRASRYGFSIATEITGKVIAVWIFKRQRRN